MAGKNTDAPRRGLSMDLVGEIQDAERPDVDLEQAVGKGGMMANAALNAPESQRRNYQIGLAHFIQRVTNGSSLQDLETARQAMLQINEASPQLAQQIIAESGSPEWLTMEFGSVEASPDAEEAAAPGRTRQAAFQRPPMERINTHGAGSRTRSGGKYTSRGLGKLTELEYRTRADRIADVDPQNAKPWQSNLIEHMASSPAYQKLNQEQAAAMAGLEVTPEMVDQMNRFERRELFRALTENPAAEFPASPEELIGRKLTPESALWVPRRIRNEMVGGRSIFDSENQALLAEIAKQGGNSNIEGEVSARDAILAWILRNASERTQTFNPEEVDVNFDWLRYPFPMSKDGQIVRPGWAPSGIAAAKMARGILRLRDDIPNWESTATPVFDAMIRSVAGTTPSRKTYRDLSGMSAYDFSQLQLPPERGGYYHKQAEKEGLGWPFFQEGVQMNPQTTPINLGGLLLDSTTSAPQPDATISTPEELPPSADVPPPVMPADGDVSFLDPRMQRMSPSILAALLA